MQEKKYKISIIVNDFSKLGGVEKVTSNLSFLFLDNNLPLHSIISLSQEYKKSKIEYPEALTIEVIKDPDKIIDYILKNNIGYIIYQLQELDQACFICEKIKSKVRYLKIYFILHNTPFLYLKRLLPNVSFLDPLRELKMNLYTKYKNLFFFKKALLLCDKFILLSPENMKEFKSIFTKNTDSKIDYIYNPSSYSYYSDIKDKQNIITYLGRLAVGKRVLETVKIIAPLLKYYNWKFIILGDGDERSRIQEFINEQNISNVKLLGSVSNVNEYLVKSKITVLYSLFEGLPTSLLEAGFCENALVASNSKGGVKDIIKNGGNGYIVEDDNELFKKIQNLILDEKLLKNMQKNNVFLKDKFSNESILRKWETILKL